MIQYFIQYNYYISIPGNTNCKMKGSTIYHKGSIIIEQEKPINDIDSVIREISRKTNRSVSSIDFINRI